MLVDEGRTLTIERELPHAPGKVWRALTQSPLLADWMMPNDFVPEAGHGFTFRAKPVAGWDGIVTGEVIEVEEGARLSFSWRSAGIDTVVTWTLEPAGEGTRLTMAQSGFAADQEQNYQGAKYGWNGMLGRLEQVLGAMA